MVPGVVEPVVDGIVAVGDAFTLLGGTPIVDVGGAPIPLGANPFASLVPFSPGTFGPRPAAGLVVDVGEALGGPLDAAGTVIDIPSDGRYIDVDATPFCGAIVPPTGPGIGVPDRPVPDAVPTVPGAALGRVPVGVVEAAPSTGSCTLPPAVPVRPPMVAPALPVAGRFGLAAAPPGPPFDAALGPVDPLAVAAVGPSP